MMTTGKEGRVGRPVGRARGSMNKHPMFFARFLMPDGSFVRAHPPSSVVDEERSKAEKRIVLRSDVDPQRVFCREVFGDYDVVRSKTSSGDSIDEPVVHDGLFFRYEPEWVGRGKGAMIGGTRCSYRFEMVPKRSGFVDMEWAGEIGEALSRIRRLRERLDKLRFNGSAPVVDSTKRVDHVEDVDPVVVATVILDGKLVKAHVDRFGGREILVAELRKRPATTLVSLGVAVVGKRSVRLKDKLRDEWAPVVLGLAKRALGSVRKSRAMEQARRYDDARGVLASSQESKMGQKARGLFSDLVQEGFLKLFEVVADFSPAKVKRFDKYAYVSISRAIRSFAFESVGEEVSLDESKHAIDYLAAPDMSPEDEAEYASVARVGAPALQAALSHHHSLCRGAVNAVRLSLSTPFFGVGKGCIRVNVEASCAEERLLVALMGTDLCEDRVLTKEGEAAKRWLQIESMLVSGQKRVTTRFSVPNLFGGQS